jgi:hypothetical protein
LDKRIQEKKEIQEKLIFKEFCHNSKDINLIYNDFLHLDSSKHRHKNGSPDFFNEKNSIVVELTEYHRDIYSNQSIRTLVSVEIEIILVFILKLLLQLNSNRSIVIAGFLVSKCETPEIIPARELESICQSILKNARDHFRSLIPPRRLNVFLNLKNVWQIHKKKKLQKQLSESIAQYIHSLPNDDNEIDPDPSNPLPDDLSHFISYMTTERTILDSDELDSDDTKMIWQVVEAAIADVVADSVDSIIKGKDEKIDSYKKNLEQNCEIWLLIHSSRCPTVGIPDTGRVSTYGRITNELRARCFKTSFDRVYYFDKAESNVIQLKIER